MRHREKRKQVTTSGSPKGVEKKKMKGVKLAPSESDAQISSGAERSGAEGESVWKRNFPRGESPIISG